MVVAPWKKVVVAVGVVAAAFVVGEQGRARWQAHVAAEATPAPCDDPNASACSGHVKANAGLAERVTGAPRLLVFSSASCPACKRVAPDLDRAVASCNGASVVDHVDVDEDEGSALAARYGVSLLPSFVSIDAEGAEVSRLTGVQTESALEEALAEIRGAHCALLERDRTTTPI